MQLQFPNNISVKEKEIFEKLPCLGEISDNDFNYSDEKIEPKEELSYCVRILLIEENKICVEYSKKYDYIQILGGHIEENESIESAAKRETSEEGGYEIERLSPVGYFIENGVAKKSISFVYMATPGRQIGTSYEDDEKECEFEPIWYKLEDATKVLEETDKKYIKSYNGRFATKRDLCLLRKLF